MEEYKDYEITFSLIEKQLQKLEPGAKDLSSDDNRAFFYEKEKLKFEINELFKYAEKTLKPYKSQYENKPRTFKNFFPFLSTNKELMSIYNLLKKVYVLCNTYGIEFDTRIYYDYDYALTGTSPETMQLEP